MEEGRCHGDHSPVNSVLPWTLGGFPVPLPVSKCPSVTLEAGLGHPTALRRPYTKAHGFQRPFLKKP